MKDKINNYFKGDCLSFYNKYLRQVKKIGGDEYKALCPFHDDTEPSLNFNNQTGKYFCHGCGKKSDAFHFYGKINGLDTRRDFSKILKGIANDFGITWEETFKKSNNRPDDKYITKTWPYVDEKAKCLYESVRYDLPDGSKEYRPRHKNSKGDWSYDLKGVRRVLYRLPELLKANEVLLLEGEKSVDTVEDLGFIGTTIQGGCKQKLLDEDIEALKGKMLFYLRITTCQAKSSWSELHRHLTEMLSHSNG